MEQSERVQVNPTLESLLSGGLLTCPSCGQGGLIREGEGISCPSCKKIYPLWNGVVDLFFQFLEDSAPDNRGRIDDTFVRALIRKVPLRETDENIRRVHRILERLFAKSRSGPYLAEIHSLAKRFDIPEPKAGRLDRLLHFFRPPVKKNVDLCIAFQRHYIPERLPAGTRLFRNVRFTNTGRYAWSSRAPGPVHLSYHWFDNRHECVCWDGERTAFPVEILPGMTLSLPLCIVTPDRPGEYILSVSLVQEDTRWVMDPVLEIPLTIVAGAEDPVAVDFHEQQPEYAGDHALAAGILADHLRQHYPRHIRVLEIGGGCHPQSAILPDCSLVTLDISLPLLEIGSCYFRERDRTDILFLCADGTSPPFAPETFDGVVIFSSLHHIPEPVLFLKNLHRILKPGGFLGIFCEPVATSMEDENLKEELRKGINEQVFGIEEYAAMFAAAGFVSELTRVDGGSLKTILSRP